MNYIFETPTPIWFKLYDSDKIYQGTGLLDMVEIGYYQCIPIEEVEIFIINFGHSELVDYQLF